MTAAVEMAPVWTKHGERGVVSEGPVGSRFLGRSRLFRYEVRCWRGGSIPDLAAAVGGPVRMCSDPETARRIVDLVPDFPAHTWGRGSAPRSPRGDPSKNLAPMASAAARCRSVATWAIGTARHNGADAAGVEVVNMSRYAGLGRQER